MINRRVATGALAAAVFAPSARAQASVPVVASFSILGDLVRQVGGARVNVTTLVGSGGDSHTYSPKPGDAAAITRARLVVFNGLGFEGWADRLIGSTGYQGERVVATRGVKALRGSGGVDPHAWQEVANVKTYVANIRDGLARVDPPGTASYTQRAVAYSAQLDRLDAEIRGSFAGVPRERRRVITSHDAFGYFGDAYDIVFMAPQGLSTASEPSAAVVAQLVRQVREQSIRAIFVENIGSRGAVAQIARETGIAIGGTLYSDSLPAGGNYIGMMRHNTRTIATALKR